MDKLKLLMKKYSTVKTINRNHPCLAYNFLILCFVKGEISAADILALHSHILARPTTCMNLR